MEGKYEKETYIALNPCLVRNRIFYKNKKKLFPFFSFLFHKATEAIPETLDGHEQVVVIHTNKCECKNYINEILPTYSFRKITMTDIKSFLRKIEKEKLATLDWNNGDLMITFSEKLMHYGED